jgi:sulfonate dioxygenase
MAPGLIETQSQSSTASFPVQPAKPTNTHNYIPGRTTVQKHDTYPYEDLRPHFPSITWPAYTEIPYIEKGQLGDPHFKNLLASATDVFDYNPKIGTEIHGVDLANLTDAQKNDLARLIATRGVVFFRDQKNFGIDEQRELGKYFGELHRHATTGVPKREGLEDVHVIYTGEGSPDLRALFSPSFLWHSDVRSSLTPLSRWTLLTDLGNIRTPTPLLHLPQSPNRPTPRRRRRYPLVFPIRSLRHALTPHANLPLFPHRAALRRPASPGSPGSRKNSASRASDD